MSVLINKRKARRHAKGKGSSADAVLIQIFLQGDIFSPDAWIVSHIIPFFHISPWSTFEWRKQL